MKKISLFLLIACGSSPKQAQRPPDDQGWEAKPLPRHGAPKQCDERVTYAMASFDAGKGGAKCADYCPAHPAPACDPAPDTCANSCGAGTNPNETHEHWHMLMTAPPP
jgi:hypothetical protein